MNGEGKRLNLFFYYNKSYIFLLQFHSFLFSFSLFSPARYYRANSVRFPTQPCEGVCSLNHYCAITRIDYREYHQCLETAASALASRTRSNNNTNKILLLLIALIQLLLSQQFVLTEVFSSAIHAKMFALNRFRSLISSFDLMRLQAQRVC